MELKLANMKLFKLTKLESKPFNRKQKLEDITINERELGKVYNYPIDPSASKTTTNKRFIKTNDGEQGGNHRTYFYSKENNTYYFDSFGDSHDKFLLNYSPKAITYHNYTNQDKNSRLCGINCF